VSDLFDRIAAQALGLPSALRPRPRSRFEPEAFEGSGFGTDEARAGAFEMDGFAAVTEVQVAADTAAVADDSPETASPAKQVAAPSSGDATDTSAGPNEAPRHFKAAPARAPAGADDRAVPLAQGEEQGVRPTPTLGEQGADHTRAAGPALTLAVGEPVRTAAGPRDPSRQAARGVLGGGVLDEAIAPPPRPMGRHTAPSKAWPERGDAAPSAPATGLPPGAPAVAQALRSVQPPARVETVVPVRDRGSVRPPNASLPAAPPHAESRPAPAPSVEITIGRLEIRADPAPAARPTKRWEPHLDLAAWHGRRERGR
jgi:hypothetical protein